MNVRAKTVAALVKAKALIEMRYPEPTVVWFAATSEDSKRRVEEAARDLGIKPESLRVFVNGTLGDCPRYLASSDEHCAAPAGIPGHVKA